MTSLSAVSEAPASRQVVDHGALGGRFRYSDLKEAAPGASLWVLYVVEQARQRYRVAVGGSARQLQREIVGIERTGRGWREGWQGIVGQLRRRDFSRAGARG